MVSESPSNWAFVLCNAVYSPWRQRRVLGEVASLAGASFGLLVIVTPDGDLYIKGCSGNNGNVATVRFAIAFRTLPGGIARDRVYRFREKLSASALADALQQCELAAAEWWGRQMTEPPDDTCLLVLYTFENGIHGAGIIHSEEINITRINPVTVTVCLHEVVDYGLLV